MGLRINTNVTALRSLRNLRVNDSNQARSLERLSTGLRINRGSDDPSGLVISEALRAQLASLNKAVENSQNASNLISVADSALQETANLLTQIQNSIVFALNTGGSSPAQISAEQSAVDQAIAAIDRIAATTRYSDRSLLNGTAGYTVVDDKPSGLLDLNIKAVSFAPGELNRDLTVQIITNPRRGETRVNGVRAVGSTTVRISGPRGTEDVIVASSTGSQGIASAINGVAGFTGVFASGTATAGGNLVLYTEDFGKGQLVRVEIVGGTLSNTSVQTRDDSGSLVNDTSASTSFSVGEVVTDRGLDGQAQFQGQMFTGVGRQFNLLTRAATIGFNLDADQIDLGTLAATQTFRVTNTGLNFQLNELPRPTDQISLGINAVASSQLGAEQYRDRISEAVKGVSTYAGASSQVQKGGFLNTLVTGSANDLTNNPGNGSEVVKAAISQVATLRGYIGAVQAFSIQPNINAVSVGVENLTASLSSIRDLDFAAETSNFTRTQILYQSGIAVLASSNLIPQSVLTLLR